MKVNAEIYFEYLDDEYARISYESLKLDNDEGYIESTLNNNILEYYLSNSSLGSFLNSCDDLISSEILVEKIFENVK